MSIQGLKDILEKQNLVNGNEKRSIFQIAHEQQIESGDITEMNSFYKHFNQQIIPYQEQQKKQQEKERQKAEKKRIKEEKKRIKAEEKKRKAEEKRRKAEERKKRKAEEKRRKAEERKRAYEARKKAEEQNALMQQHQMNPQEPIISNEQKGFQSPFNAKVDKFSENLETAAKQDEQKIKENPNNPYKKPLDTKKSQTTTKKSKRENKKTYANSTRKGLFERQITNHTFNDQRYLEKQKCYQNKTSTVPATEKDPYRNFQKFIQIDQTAGVQVFFPAPIKTSKTEPNSEILQISQSRRKQKKFIKPKKTRSTSQKQNDYNQIQIQNKFKYRKQSIPIFLLIRLQKKKTNVDATCQKKKEKQKKQNRFKKYHERLKKVYQNYHFRVNFKDLFLNFSQQFVMKRGRQNSGQFTKQKGNYESNQQMRLVHKRKKRKRNALPRINYSPKNRSSSNYKQVFKKKQKRKARKITQYQNNFLISAPFYNINNFGSLPWTDNQQPQSQPQTTTHQRLPMLNQPANQYNYQYQRHYFYNPQIQFKLLPIYQQNFFNKMQQIAMLSPRSQQINSTILF